MGIEELLPEEVDKVIIECYHCHEPMMAEKSYNREMNWSMYQCLSDECNKTYLMCWDDQSNWYNEQRGGKDYENNKV